MMRTRCPHCSKLLGINESAAGTVALCPVCKKKFRVPAAAASAAEGFPEVELVEEGDAIASPAPSKGPARKPRPPGDEAEVVLRDDEAADEAVDEEDEPRPKKGPRKGKKKRDEVSALMVLRYRIVGAVAALIGFGIMAYSLFIKDLKNFTDQFGDTGWYVAAGFGGLLGLVGLFYVVRPTGGSA